MSSTSSTLARWCGVLLIATVFTFGCERKPEDLEQWRNAQGGMEKMQEWAMSKKESAAVRARALQILIEKDKITEIKPIMEAVKDDAVKAEMVTAGLKTAEELWATQDYPTVTEDMKDKNTQMNVGDLKSVRGIEAAYFLQPYASDAQKKQIEVMFAEWLSKDHELRKQLSSRTSLGQLVPMAGAKGMDGMMVWFESTKEPSKVADAVRQYGDDKTKERFTKAILERAMKDHPNISQQLLVIIAQLEDEAIVPYLERAIDDSKSPGPLADAMMDTYIRIKGPASTAKLNELVAKRQDVMRSVAFTRLIEVRGEAGVIQGATALPLELEAYPTTGDNTLEKDAAYMCNIIKSELEKTHKVKDHKPVVKKMLDSSRWPAQAIAIQCAKQEKWADWKPAIEALVESQQIVPGWGVEGTTLGSIAQDTATSL